MNIRKLWGLIDAAESMNTIVSLSVKNVAGTSLFRRCVDMVRELESEGEQFSSRHLVSCMGGRHVESFRLDLPKEDFIFVEVTTKEDCIDLEIQYSLDGNDKKPRRPSSSSIFPLPAKVLD